MKKTIKSIAAVFVVLTLCLGLLSGCGNSDLIGRWNNTQGGYMELKADGSCDLNGENSGAKCTWERSGDKLTIRIGAEGTDFNIPMEMTIVSCDGKTLVLELAGEQTTFTKA